MSQAEIDRVRGDIAAIREAAGLVLPFGWEDVWVALALGPVGAVIAALGAFAPLGMIRVGALAAIAPLVAFAVAQRVRFRRSTGRSPVRRREYTLGIVAAVLLAGLAGGVMAWSRSRGEPTGVLGGTVVAFSGALCLVLALTSPGRRSLFAAAAALLPYGFAIPFCSPRQVVMLGGAAMAVAGLLGAAIEAWQLKTAGAADDPAAH